MTDLTPAEQKHLFAVIMAVEVALRRLMNPDKINLASLGNKVPHLHWHVIPRFRNDPHFPEAVWSSSRHPAMPRPLPAVEALTREIAAAVRGPID